MLSVLDYYHDGKSIQPPRVLHQGTYNAGPVSAAAGIATLKQVRDTDAVERASRAAALIRGGMNAAIRRSGLRWCVYGLFSDFHLYCGDASPEDIYAGRVPWQHLKGATSAALIHKIRTGFLLHGVDIVGWPGGIVSAAHTNEDVDRTVEAFERTIEMLSAEGES